MHGTRLARRLHTRRAGAASRPVRRRPDVPDGRTEHHHARLHNVTFDAEQPRTLGRFWSEVTGYSVVDERDDFVRLRAPGHLGAHHMLFIRVDDPTPGKNRVHVDLAAPEPDEEIRRLVGLGASLVDEPEDRTPRWREGNGVRWVVLRDPEGNEFCLGADPERR